MTDYKYLKPLYEFLKLKNIPKKHGNDSLGWQIAKHLHNQVLITIEVVVQGVKFVALTCDEVITMDYQNWISIHGYCV
jgi:hypothetical protein